MKVKTLDGVILVDILTLILLLTINFTEVTWVRLLIGLPVLMLFPGYTLLCALFVRNEGMDGLEKLALSFITSIAVVAMIGFGLNYTSWGIELMPVLYAVTALIVLTSAVALLRRAITFGGIKLTSQFTLRLPVKEPGRAGKFITLILIVSIVIAGSVLGFTLAAPQKTGTYTEFYVLGLNGSVQEYPTQFIMDGNRVTNVLYGANEKASAWGEVTLGIVNNEKETVTYSVRVLINGQPAVINAVSTLNNISLKHGERWEQKIGFAPQYTGDNQKAVFMLFKGSNPTAANTVHFWVDVK